MQYVLNWFQWNCIERGNMYENFHKIQLKYYFGKCILLIINIFKVFYECTLFFCIWWNLLWLKYYEMENVNNQLEYWKSVNENCVDPKINNRLCSMNYSWNNNLVDTVRTAYYE